MSTIGAALLQSMASQWAALGGTLASAPDGRVVDPEALIAISAAMAERDPRIAEISVAWQNEFGRFLNLSRMKVIRGRLAHPEFQPSEFPHASVRASLIRPLNQFDTPALALLRSRATMGVNARADILAMLASSQRDAWTTASLARRVNLTKRAIAIALDSLVLGGLVEVRSDPRRATFALTTTGLSVLDALGITNLELPDWTARFSAALHLISFEERFLGTRRAYAVEARRVIESVKDDLVAGDIRPPISVRGQSYADAFDNWLRQFSRLLTQASLFGDRQRVEARPRRNAESRFAFYDRVAGPVWERIRLLLDEWFSDVPTTAQSSIKARLQSADDGQSAGAFWELYLHEIFRRVGATVEMEPMLAEVRHRPDFRVELGERVMLVEATVATTSNELQADARRRGQLYDAWNAISSPDFYLAIEELTSGLATPPTSSAARQVRRWLASLDPDHVLADVEQNGPLAAPTMKWSAGGWAARVRAIPKSPEHRASGGDTVGIYPAEGGLIDPSGDILRKLESKRDYAVGGRASLCIALLVESVFADEDDVARALYGRAVVPYGPPGYWSLESPSRNSSVSAVITAINLAPHNVARISPTLWIAPGAPEPMGLPFPTRQLEPGTQKLIRGEPSAQVAHVLGLATDWPGPEAPFENN